MEKVGGRQYLDALRLARDLCTGVASFFAMPDGSVMVSISPVLNLTSTSERVRVLAERCLSHPMAQGRQFFTNAELDSEGLSGDGSLACIAVPIWVGDRWFGIIGVVDIWIPDLDEEQRFGLQRIGSILARRAAEDRTSEQSVRQMVEPEVSGLSRPTVLGPSGFEEGRESDRELSVSEPDTIIDEIADVLPEALLVTRLDGTIVYLNGAFAELSGVEPEYVLGSDVETLFTSDDHEMLTATQNGDLTEFLLGMPSPGRRLVLTAGNGERFPVDVSGRRVTMRSIGECFVAQIRDARQWVAGAGPVGVDEWSLETALDALDEGIVVCDADGVVRFINLAGRELQGIDLKEDLVGRPFPATPGLFTSSNTVLTWEQHPVPRALRGTVIRNEHFFLGSDEASRLHILASAQPLLVAGHRGALLMLRDITSQTIEEERLTHFALHDPLTGLANRSLLLDHLRRVLGDSRNRDGIVAVVFLDLDGFKLINDQYGHDVGDEVLIAVGKRLQGTVRTSDIVARLGGDEFVVAHSSSGDSSEIHRVVSRIRKSLSVPYQVRGHTLAVTCSTGWVVADPTNDDPIDLLVRADREMYRSKRNRLAEEGYG